MNNIASDITHSSEKSKAKNILIKSFLIVAIISALVLFFAVFYYSGLNDGAEIFHNLKNGV